MKNKFCDIISVDRDHKCMSHVNSETFNLSELPKKNFHLFHFATLYNPKPKTYQEIELIINANINFPLEVIKSNSAITKAYCMQSYQELLPIHLQNEYSMSKRVLTRSLKSCGFEVCEFYLFDNFGFGDKRGKVVDKFIDKALAGDDILIPNDDVHINLCLATNIIENILNFVDCDQETLLIGNKENIKLADLAHFIVSATSSRSKVIKSGRATDLMRYVSGVITNFSGYNLEVLYEDLAEHINVKRANYF